MESALQKALREYQQACEALQVASEDVDTATNLLTAARTRYVTLINERGAAIAALLQEAR